MGKEWPEGPALLSCERDKGAHRVVGPAGLSRERKPCPAFDILWCLPLLREHGEVASPVSLWCRERSRDHVLLCLLEASFPSQPQAYLFISRTSQALCWVQ